MHNAEAQSDRDAEKSREKDIRPGFLSHIFAPVVIIAFILFLMSSGFCFVTGLIGLTIRDLPYNYWQGDTVSFVAFLLFITEGLPLFFIYVLLRQRQNPIKEIQRFFAFHRERQRIEKMKVS